MMIQMSVRLVKMSLKRRSEWRVEAEMCFKGRVSTLQQRSPPRRGMASCQIGRTQDKTRMLGGKVRERFCLKVQRWSAETRSSLQSHSWRSNRTLGAPQAKAWLQKESSGLSTFISRQFQRRKKSKSKLSCKLRQKPKSALLNPKSQPYPRAFIPSERQQNLRKSKIGKELVT